MLLVTETNTDLIFLVTPRGRRVMGKEPCWKKTRRLIGNGFIFFSITMIPSTLLMPVKSYLERKKADKIPPESRPEYYRGSIVSPCIRVWQELLCPVESSHVYLKSGCCTDENLQCTRKSFRALGFLKLFPLVLGVLRHIRLWPMETHLGENLQYLIKPTLHHNTISLL